VCLACGRPSYAQALAQVEAARQQLVLLQAEADGARIRGNAEAQAAEVGWSSGWVCAGGGVSQSMAAGVGAPAMAQAGCMCCDDTGCARQRRAGGHSPGGAACGAGGPAVTAGAAGGGAGPGGALGVGGCAAEPRPAWRTATAGGSTRACCCSAPRPPGAALPAPAQAEAELDALRVELQQQQAELSRRAEALAAAAKEGAAQVGWSCFWAWKGSGGRCARCAASGCS
jgi:Tfp pilus assembly protein PilV